MLRMSLINVAVKSGPPSPCPFCCSVLVPLQCPQSHEQIVTLMMDTHPPLPHPPGAAPQLVSGHCPPSALSPQGEAERRSQPVRQPCSPHQFRESGRQPRIPTSLALTSLGWGGVERVGVGGVWVFRLEDFRNRGEKPLGARGESRQL